MRFMNIESGTNYVVREDASAQPPHPLTQALVPAGG